MESIVTAIDKVARDTAEERHGYQRVRTAPPHDVGEAGDVADNMQAQITGQCRIRRAMPRTKGLVAGALSNIFADLTAGKLPWPLLIHGGTGVGKTCAGLVFHDWTPWARWLDIDGLTIQAWSQFEVDNWYWWNQIGKAPLVIVDELAAGEANKVEYRGLKRLLDIREQRCNRTGVYISNHPPPGIAERYDQRIASRLCCGTVFELTGPDRRKA